MNRTPASVWFAAAFCAFAPALLEADIQRDGTALRPLQRSFHRGGLAVTLDVDRAIAITGTTATATITARSKVPEDVALELRVVGTKLEPGARTPGTSRELATKQIQVHATPGGTTVTEPIQLDEADPRLGDLERFTIYVAPVGRLPDEDPGTEQGRRTFAPWEKAVHANRAAAIDVMGWSGDIAPMEVAADGPIVVGQPFRIAIRVTGVGDATEPALSFASGIGEVEDIGAVIITPADDAQPFTEQYDERPEQDPRTPATFRTLDREIVDAGSDGRAFVEHVLVTPKRAVADLAFSVYARFEPTPGGSLDAYDVVAFHAEAPAQTAARWHAQPRSVDRAVR